MKFLNLLFLFLLLSTCKAQDNPLLVHKKLISDWSQMPAYGVLTHEVNGQVEWKPKYQYLDSIEVYSIAYLSDGLLVKGMLAQPAKAGVYPSVIYNRGGNREMGALKWLHGAIFLGEIAKEGYVVIASQYRGNSGGEGQEEFGGKDINDVLALFDVLKEVERADSENVGMMGWSRGGMMTYMALTMTDKIKAVAVGGAVSDQFASIEDRPSLEEGVLAELIPDYEKNKEAELKKRSAIKWVDKFPKDVPILMVHGNADWRVKPEQSLRLALEFEKHRVPYRLVMYEGGDHGIREHKAEVNKQIIQWFDRFLKKKEALPDMEYHGK